MRGSLLILFALTLAAASALAGTGQLDTTHNDHRTTTKLAIDPSWDVVLGTTTEGTARAFLEQRATDFGLAPDLANLILVDERESLTARHFRYQQMLNGILVDNAEIIVSIAKTDGRVMRTFNNTYPVSERAAFLPTGGISEDAAYDAAWEYVRAHGDLRSLPSTRLVYTPEGADFRLNWIVDLDLAAPDGGWRARVDAQTGGVVELTDMRLSRKPLQPVDERIAAHEGPLADRQAAFARAHEVAAEHNNSDEANKSRATGSGRVFDPDPRTTLINNYLQDNNSAGDFTDAYFIRTLEGIAYNGSSYTLNGPWVYILDWDAPSTPPSTTPDGVWDRARGHNSFNDAMTYFHLDQNQRYIQALGFVGAMGIQDGSIGADTDGFNGADNSAYYGGSNRLTFGHGCVDDNEDADVILHEYGHAINHDINSSWNGGDTGAMGEGFGDYWGGSYSYITENGDIFYPDWIYTWDGHGAGNQCWAGRSMNRTHLQYVHSTTYGAHQSIPGGISDELWSTPIFQSLRTLMDDHGQTRESVDTIMLESQFGLGYGLKMRDMANAIIATAQDLYPTGPHAQVLVEKFLVHNIIIAPVPAIGIESFTVVSEPSGNDAADPGETVSVEVVLSNNGLTEATDVVATLTTTTPDVTITQDSATFPDLLAGGSGTSSVNFTFAVGADVECGTIMQFNLRVSLESFLGPETVNRGTQLFVGVPIGAYGTESPYVPLPDNSGAQVFSYINISGTGAFVSEDFNMDINITHDAIGDLVMWLTSPSGTRAYLSLFMGGNDDDIVGNYPSTLTPAQSFDRFLGEPLDGAWELMVRDGGASGQGTLNRWALYDITGVDCTSDITDAPSDLAPASFALGQNSPNPFNPATTIGFAVPQNAGLVTLEIFDVRGAKVRTLVRGSLEAGNHTRLWEGRDDRGNQVGSGVYFYQLKGDDFSETRKMVIVQ